MRSRLVRLLAAGALIFVAGVPAYAEAPGDKLGCEAVLATAAPVGTGSCPGVRPGALYSMENGNGCSLSFMFRGSDGRYYAASAGHCIWATSNVGAAADKEEKWEPGAGMLVTDTSGTTVGRFAYGVWTDDRDFSLIRLNARPDPAMCYFGGPTSLYEDHSSSAEFLKHFGNGLLIGEIVPARTAVAPNTRDPLVLYAYTASAPGDSGSGVMTTDGKAIGTLVGINALGETTITRLDASIARAEQKTGLRFTLLTAPLNPDYIRL